MFSFWFIAGCFIIAIGYAVYDLYCLDKIMSHTFEELEPEDEKEEIYFDEFGKMHEYIEGVTII